MPHRGNLATTLCAGFSPATFVVQRVPGEVFHRAIVSMAANVGRPGVDMGLAGAVFDF